MKEPNNKSRVRGILLALLSIPVGIIIWVIIWRLGYVAALASLAMAVLAFWLYEKGARQKPDIIAIIWLLVIIIAGAVLAFLCGILSDGIIAMMEEVGVSFGEALRLSLEVLFRDSSVISAYSSDAIMAFVFTALGAGWFIVDALRSNHTPDTPTEASKR